MRNLTISEYGTFIGVVGERLVVRESDGSAWETPLSRLRSIRIEKPGMSLSGNVITACAARGIRLYFVDWKGMSCAVVHGTQYQSLAKLREAQFACARSSKALPIALEMIQSKIRNQRAVLLYFSKYYVKTNPVCADRLRSAADLLKDQSGLLTIEQIAQHPKHPWREMVMGIEGAAAHAYWQALVESALLPASFQGRQGRGATEIVNCALNYGYAVLNSYVWSALDNAGFEVFVGFLHSHRPGRASLVLDVMEEYRAWVVDRNVIKLRRLLESPAKGLDQKIKREISNSIDTTMESRILWKGKKLRLDNVIQRQAYRLAGAVCDDKTYRGMRFKW